MNPSAAAAVRKAGMEASLSAVVDKRRRTVVSTSTPWKPNGVVPKRHGIRRPNDSRPLDSAIKNRIREITPVRRGDAWLGRRQKYQLHLEPMPATLIGRDAQFQARLEPPRPLGAHATDAHNLTELFRTLYDETARAMDATVFLFALYDEASETVQVVRQMDRGVEHSGGTFPL